MTDILNWSQLQADFELGSSLIGNGLSRSIWTPFDYHSLFRVAQRVGLHNDDVRSHGRRRRRLVDAAPVRVRALHAYEGRARPGSGNEQPTFRPDRLEPPPELSSAALIQSVAHSGPRSDDPATPLVTFFAPAPYPVESPRARLVPYALRSVPHVFTRLTSFARESVARAELRRAVMTGGMIDRMEAPSGIGTCEWPFDRPRSGALR